MHSQDTVLLTEASLPRPHGGTPFALVSDDGDEFWGLTSLLRWAGGSDRQAMSQRPPNQGVPVTELPGWTVSGEVVHFGPDQGFSSGSQYVRLGRPDFGSGGQVEQSLDGAALRGQTVIFQVVSVGEGTLTLGDQSRELVGSIFEETTHTVSFDVPADAPDVLPLRVSADLWAVDSISASYTPPCPASTDVQVSLTGPTSAPKGSFVTYTLQVTNSGEAAATDVTSVIGAAGLSNVTTTRRPVPAA
jgi:hypothetical protein